MATIFGTNGADELIGTAKADAIYGFWGDDSISGGGGRDFIYAGNGNDTLDGGPGFNVLDGGGGFDMVLYGNLLTPFAADLRTGVVSFFGQPGDTLIDVEAIDAGYGNDTVIGNGAGNLFRGNGGNDVLTGNIGSDTLIGGLGADSLDGGNGQDSLVGGFGNDTMLGGLHNDIFTIGPIVEKVDDTTLALVDFGRDRIDGGGGTDTLHVSAPVTFMEYPDAIGSGFGLDLAAPDVRANLSAGTLRLGDSTNRSTLISIENIETGSGNDSINGSAGDNYIAAGDGLNVVYAGGGNDTIVGGAEIYPGFGHENDYDPLSAIEILNGGAGNDAIWGMGSEGYTWGGGGDPGLVTGLDILVGGAGNDTLYGGVAVQRMSGGTGADVFVLTSELAPTTGLPYYPPTEITDFEHGRDLIRLDPDDPDAPDWSFVGAVEPTTLEEGEIGYERTQVGTTVFCVLDPGDVGDDSTTLVITLAGYTGALTASDFDLG